jgi:hypothetical protein
MINLITATNLGNTIGHGASYRYLNRVTSLVQTRPGHYEGTADGEAFKITGGKHAGGTSRQWFVQWNRLGDFYMNATSIIDAINLIETA